jgi:pilus assembly protein Flp/PilA
MAKFVARVKRFLAREDGPTMTEYALMVALIAIVSIGVVTALGGEISTVFDTIKNSLAAVV